MENTVPQFIPEEVDAGEDAGAEGQATNTIAEDDPKSEARAALAKELRKYKVKIDDQEHEVDEEELLKGYQLSKASQKRMQEAAMQRKQVEEVLQLLKTDPSKVMKQLGLNDEEFAEKVFERRLKRASMTPEQIELEELKQKFAEIEDQKRQAKEQEEAQSLAQLTAKYEEHYDTVITESLEQSGLPKTPYVVRRMAYYLQQALEQNVDLQPAQLAELTREDYIREFQSVVGSTGDGDLTKILGEAGLKKIAKTFNKQTMPGQPYKRAPVEASKAPQPKGPKPKMTREEFQEYLAKQRE